MMSIFSLFSQTKLTDCQNRVKQLEERIKQLDDRILQLEALNFKLLERFNESVQTKQENEFVISVSVGQDNRRSTRLEGTLNHIKLKLKLPYSRVYSTKDLGTYDMISQTRQYSYYYTGEIGFFRTRQEAHEVIGKYLSEYSDNDITVKTVEEIGK